MTTAEPRPQNLARPRRDSLTERIIVGTLAIVVLGMGVYLVQDFRAALSDGRFSGNRIAGLESRSPPTVPASATADATPVD